MLWRLTIGASNVWDKVERILSLAAHDMGREMKFWYEKLYLFVVVLNLHWEGKCRHLIPEIFRPLTCNII